MNYRFTLVHGTIGCYLSFTYPDVYIYRKSTKQKFLCVKNGSLAGFYVTNLYTYDHSRSVKVVQLSDQKIRNCESCVCGLFVQYSFVSGKTNFLSKGHANDFRIIERHHNYYGV